MNNNQDNKRKVCSPLDVVLFSHTYREVSLALQKKDPEYAEIQVNNFANRVKEESKEIYGDLLSTAACHNDIKTAKFCKEKGANLNHRAHSNRSPLGCAEHSGYKEMADNLQEWGATDNTYGKRNQPSSSLNKCSDSNQEKQNKGKKNEEECILM